MNLTDEQVQDFYRQYMEQRLPKEQLTEPTQGELKTLFLSLVQEWKDHGLVLPDGDSLADAPPFLPGNLYDYLHDLHNEVDEARKIGVLSGELSPVYVGAINRGSYNAEHRRIPLGGGAIVLIDAGLLTLSYLFGKILFEATPYLIPKVYVELPGLGVLNTTEGMDHVPAILDEPQMINQLQILIDCTLSGDPRTAPRIPSRPRGPFAALPAVFSEACTKFTIGHELGHLVEKEIGLIYEFEGFESLPTTQLEEYRCDLFATNIQFHIFKQKYTSAKDNTIKMRALLELVAPLHLFDLWTVLDLSKYIASDNHTIPYKSHPPFVLRREKISATIVELIVSTMDNHAQIIAEFIDLSKMLGQHVSRYLAAMHKGAEADGIDMTDFKYSQKQ